MVSDKWEENPGLGMAKSYAGGAAWDGRKIKMSYFGSSLFHF